MKKILTYMICCAVLLFAAAACTFQDLGTPRLTLRHAAGDSLKVYSLSGDVRSMTVATKSAYISPSFNDAQLTSITVAAYDHSSGALYTSGHFTSGFNAMEILLHPGDTYDLYALANMGDQTSNIPATRSAMLSSFTYTVPSYVDVNLKGIPMTGRIENFTAGTSVNTTFSLRRLFAKVTLNVTTQYDGGTSEGVKVTNLAVGNGNAVLHGFAQSALTSSLDRISVEDYQTNSTVNAASVVFYVPENRQGTIGSATTSRDKNPDTNSAVNAVRDLLTYVDVTVTADSEFYDGTVHYRSYVGANATTDFNVVGNYCYVWNMTLTEDGLVNDDWKIDQDLDDNRYLQFLTDPVLVEAGDVILWEDILSTNIPWASINKVYGGDIIYDEVPTSTGFTVASDAQDGDIMSATFSPLHNWKASLEDATNFRVFERYLDWDQEIYAVNPRMSVTSEVLFGDTYNGREYGQGATPGTAGLKWTVIPPEVEGNTSNSKLSYSYSSATDRIVWTPSKYAYPGDYTIHVESEDGRLSDDAILRVNDTRWVNTDRAGSGNLRRTTSFAYSTNTQRTWNIEYAFGDKSNSNDNTKTWSGDNYLYYAGQQLRTSGSSSNERYWSNHISMELAANGNNSYFQRQTNTYQSITYRVSGGVPPGNYKVYIYWTENPSVRDSAVLTITGSMIQSITLPERVYIRKGSSAYVEYIVNPAGAAMAQNLNWTAVDGSSYIQFGNASYNQYTSQYFKAINGQNIGTAHVKAVSRDGNAAESNIMEVIVYDTPTSLRVVPSPITVSVNETQTFRIYARYSDGTEVDVTDDVHTISEDNANMIDVLKDVSNGWYVQGKVPGNTGFRVYYDYPTGDDSYGTVNTHVDVTVSGTYDVLRVTPNPLNIYIGESGQLSAMLYHYVNGVQQGGGEVVYPDYEVISGTSYASVTGSGSVSGLAEGTATVRATYEGSSGTLTDMVTVNVMDETPEYELVVTPASASFPVGDIRAFNAVLNTVFNGQVIASEYVEATWYVADGGSYISGVEGEQGSTVLVVGEQQGSAHIYATYGEYVSNSAYIEITEAPVYNYYLEIRPDGGNVIVGETLQLNAYLVTQTIIGGQVVSTDGGVLVSATWSVADGSSYASVDGSGLVNGVAQGTATIHAAYHSGDIDVSDDATVTVVDAGGSIIIEFDD